MSNYSDLTKLRDENIRSIRKLNAILTLADDELAKAIAKTKLKYPTTYKQGAFYARNKSLSKDINKIITQLQSDLKIAMTGSVEKSWNLANSKNDAGVSSYLKGLSISSSVRSSFMQLNLDALQAFIKRSDNGITFSDRIWNLANGKQDSLEQFLASGITTGRSAAGISRDIRLFETNPNKLFRRVRDEDGILQLSKAARAYHPGRGVYRSSYKNAMRLTRTENMIAYHTSDFKRVQQLPFVIGVKVNLSASHPKLDICDPMSGIYPKEFVFTGWHPHCLCYQTTILSKKKDFINFINNGTPITGQVKRIPVSAGRYLKDNRTKIFAMKSKPYWLSDNFSKGYNFKNKSINPI